MRPQSLVKATARVSKHRVLERLRSGSALERRAYFAILSGGFRRERRAVAAGQDAYSAAVHGDGQRFMVRRNTHMIEKGLIMRPRRDTFAAAYIEQTIEGLRVCATAMPPMLSEPELEWVLEVLEQYMEATRSSDAPEIVRAREAFHRLEMDRRTATPGVSGPQLVTREASPVEWVDLHALAARRKSVRWFSDTPVDREIVDRAMLVAAESPSACNRQPFEFRIFDDPALVERVAAIPGGTRGYGHSIRHIAVIVGDLSAFFDERDRHLIYIDGCLAAMGFILGLEAQGVASCCINWPDVAATEAKMRATLGLAAHERPVMLVAFGYADPTGSAPFSARRSLSSLRRYNVASSTEASHDR